MKGRWFSRISHLWSSHDDKTSAKTNSEAMVESAPTNGTNGIKDAKEGTSAAPLPVQANGPGVRGPSGAGGPPGGGMPPPPTFDPLNVIVIGAGIGGFATAATFRKNGHHVKLFEQSRFSNEIGAAIHVGPNASRVLRKLDFKPERLRGVLCKAVKVDKSDGSPMMLASNARVLAEYEDKWYLTHRVDLHNELKTLATGEEGPGKPAELHLSSKVTAIDSEEGVITLANGETHQGDLIVGADGIHSIVREKVFGDPTTLSTGEAAFRFILDAESIYNDPTIDVISRGDETCHVFVAPERRVIIYPCRDGTLLNFVLLHAAEYDVGATWNSDSSVEKILEIYKSPEFSPQIIKMLSQAENVKCWQLLKRNPIESWVKGRVCIIGDAAHPMLPHQGQGGGQAIEDGATLGSLFYIPTGRDQVKKVLELYQAARYKRGSKIEWLSATQAAGKGGIHPAITHKFIFDHDAVEFGRLMRSSDLIV